MRYPTIKNRLKVLAAALSMGFIAACGKADDTPLRIAATHYNSWTGGLVGVWHPAGAPKGVMILHQGHDCFSECAADSLRRRAFPEHDLAAVRDAFVAAGLIVYGFEMPLLPHDGPIERYYKPVIDLLDTLSTSLPIYMSGLSGGGWTTTVVTALDARIARGYSVAGDPATAVTSTSVPGTGCWDTTPAPSCTPDWEQRNPPYDYMTMYAMAAGRLMHVYIPGEPGGYRPIGDIGYPYVLDESVTSHTFSPWSVHYILSDIGL